MWTPSHCCAWIDINSPVGGMLILSDQVFLNIVLDDAVEEKAGGEKVRIGMVVRDGLQI